MGPKFLELQFIPLNYYIFTTASNFLTCIFLSFFVLLKNFRSNLNRTFSAFCFAIAQWSFFYFLFLSTKDMRLADFYIRTCMIGVIFMPSTFTHFVTILIGAKKNKPLIFLNYLISISITAIAYSSLYAKTGGSFLVFPYWPLAGVLFPVHLGHFFINLLYSYPLIFRTLKESNGILRGQIRYVLLGTGIGFLGGLTNYFAWYRIGVPPVLNISASLGVPIISYAIIRYHFMDIDLVRRYVAIYFSFGIVTIVLFTPLIFLFRHSIPGLMITGFVMIFSAPHLHRWMTKGLEPAFLGETYRIRQQLDKLKEAELGYISEQVAWNLVEGVAEILGVVKVSFFMLVKSYREFRPQAQLGLDNEIGCEPICWVTLKPGSPVVKFLADSKKLLIKEELTREGSLDNLVVQEMERLHSEVSIPLFVRGELKGILSLGPKENQEMFHEDDIKKLVELCRRAESHLAHTLFMEERASFSRELAHDMKNLVTKAIMPTLEMILEEKDPEKKEQRIKDLTRQHIYLEACLKGNFDLISIIERIAYKKFILEPGQIVRVISASNLLYKDALIKKSISVETDSPKNLPLVLMNKEDILKVFNNLFDNAIKFTPPGGKITIKAEQKEDEVLITFSDTGSGMSKEDLEHIFEPKLKMPDEGEEGTGLGLVIVKDIIEAHGGRIWVESEVGKGTTFYFTLRIAKDKEDSR